MGQVKVKLETGSNWGRVSNELIYNIWNRTGQSGGKTGKRS